MPAREPLICPNWCPFVQGDILSQIWSLHSAAAHVSSTIYNLVILFEQGQNFALQRDVWFYLGKKITSWCRRVWVELSFAISLVCSVIITFFMGFMTSFNPVSRSPVLCFYEQAYLHSTCDQHIFQRQPFFVLQKNVSQQQISRKNILRMVDYEKDLLVIMKINAWWLTSLVAPFWQPAAP